MSLPTAVASGLGVVNDRYDRFEAWLIEDKRSLYGAALARILSGCSVMGILITNFRVRDQLFGPGSVWNKPMQDNAMYWPPRIVENMSSTTFLFYYLLVIALAVMWVLGWHTRLVGPLMLIGEISIIERIPVLGDQGDNILRVGLLLLMFMHTNEYWSLDARRRASTDPDASRTARGLVRNLWNSHYVVPRWFSNGTHNVFLIAMAIQLMMIYFSAGLYKVQGALWQHGTALYYPLQLQEYKPFPFLTDVFTHFGILVGIATYAAVFLQLGFSFALMHPVARRAAIFVAIVFHLSIAVLMALPWFSLSMIAFDAIFVSTSTFVLFDGWVRSRWQPVADLFWDVVDPVAERLPARRESVRAPERPLVVPTAPRQ